MAKMNLTCPWIEYYNQISAMFRDDMDVQVIYDDEAKDIRLYVKRATKAEALSVILPKEKSFGGVTVTITIIPANGLEDPAADISQHLYEYALEDTPALAYIKQVSLPGMDLTYVVFRAQVVQYYNDNLGDVNGRHSTLYENIARAIFEPRLGLFFCTELILDQQAHA